MTREVDFVSGTTRVYGIVGDPIEQVRSPEMITAVLRQRGIDGIMMPMHAPQAAFDTVMTGLKAMANLGGLVLTIPFKAAGVDHVDVLGRQAVIVGAINALARGPDGRWVGEIFDGVGCVAGLKAAGHSLAGKRIQLIGAGGAGAAIGVAVGFEKPASLRIAELDPARAEALAAKLARIDPDIEVEIGAPVVTGVDFVLNASPVGMLGDPRNPAGTDTIPPDTVVFDAIVKPEETPLLLAARRCGCPTVQGRRMMHGQIGRIVDFFLAPETALG
jgi:shikimate dehydrogenase